MGGQATRGAGGGGQGATFLATEGLGGSGGQGRDWAGSASSVDRGNRDLQKGAGGAELRKERENTMDTVVGWDGTSSQGENHLRERERREREGRKGEERGGEKPMVIRVGRTVPSQMTKLNLSYVFSMILHVCI